VGWRIKCQLAQAEFTTPQLLSYTGQDRLGRAAVVDRGRLGGVDRIGIQPGTGSMMTPEGKRSTSRSSNQQQWMMDLGLPKNPFEQAIERSVGVFLKGPDESWTKAKQQQDEQVQQAQAAYTQQAQQAQALGQPVAPFVPPQLPPLPNPFPPRPNDSEIIVATTYAKRLSKLFVDPQFSTFDAGWQQTAIDCYQRAMQALTPPPVLPKGVTISAKEDAPEAIAAAEQAAATGKAPAPPPMPQVQAAPSSMPMGAVPQ
jgi:hypothetical protein